MKYYWVKTHRFVKWLFPNFLWEIKTNQKVVYLTFDDGPTHQITDWVLAQLHAFKAKATFFCIGSNVKDHPEIFKRIIAADHAVGNHTNNHCNGWHTELDNYIENVAICNRQISESGGLITKLFRPPYGKLKLPQSRRLQKMGYTIVMWDILSADFDENITPEACLENVLKNIMPGSIIIFHDSVKAFKNLEYALPKTLAFLTKQGYSCEVLV